MWFTQPRKLGCQVPENPGVLPKWHQEAGGNPGESQEEEKGAQKSRSPPSRSLSWKNTWLSGAVPTLHPRPVGGERECLLSAQRGPHDYPLQWSRRKAVFQSRYSLTETLCSPSELDSDLEPLGAGIQHLQILSQELAEATVTEESGICD